MDVDPAKLRAIRDAIDAIARAQTQQAIDLHEQRLALDALLVPPPPPPPAAIETQTHAITRLVLFEDVLEGGHYQRYQVLTAWDRPAVTVRIKGYDLSRGELRPLSSAEYRLLVDGVPVDTVAPGGATRATFAVDTTALAPGWHRLDIAGLAPSETAPTWWACVVRGQMGEQPTMPVVTGTFVLGRQGTGRYQMAQVPGRFAPRAVPLAPREYVRFAAMLTPSQIHSQMLVPVRSHDIHRPNVHRRHGVLSTFDRQAYFTSDMIARTPPVALLDGPRGVAAVSMLTHVQHSDRGPTYACTPWSVVRFRASGEMTTLVGYRHRGVMDHWAGPHEPELVGDWSAIPAERRGFHELWGMAWDTRTTGRGTGDPIPNPPDGDEPPHDTAPVMFVADSQNNRICRVEFDRASHATPAKVTEFIGGLADPWDVVFDAGVLYVSERRASLISAWDATTGARLRTVVQGNAAMAVINAQRVAQLTVPIDTARAEPCVAPEGLYAQDGWLYFGSLAVRQVRRVHMVTGEVQSLFSIGADGNTLFCKIALSDGTFGPRGTVFGWTWSKQSNGLPWAVAPTTGGGWTGWQYHHEQVRGSGQWGQMSYMSAGAASHGRLTTGSATEGVLVLSARQPGDEVASAQVDSGRALYYSRGLHLIHGDDGFGFYGLPLPWGEHPDIDAYLAFHGHTR